MSIHRGDNMRFSDEKKKSIILYLLNKIAQNAENPSKIVSDAFEVNRNTIHTYINDLEKNNIIKRVKRGKYELVSSSYSYCFLKEKNEIKNETDIYNKTLKQHIDDFPQNVKEIWEYSFSEMVNNVIDHSNANLLDIYIVKNFLKTTVFISDDGIGIFEKIRKYFNLSSLDDAICELFKGKLTTDKENHSGEGIFFSSKLMDDFAILSSDKIFEADEFDKSIITMLDTPEIGTFVVMELSNNTQKTCKEIFDKFSDVNGGFTKTVIPLKNIFDASPISRSQARRVLNSLDKFEEIILDFNGIGWMGQGFAHQIFVVFNLSQPDIRITPINMNEDVTKMYNHVLKTKS